MPPPSELFIRNCSFRLRNSYYNSISFAFTELCGRSYGGGVLEILPGEVGNIIIPKLDSVPIETVREVLGRVDLIVRADEDIEKALDNDYKKMKKTFEFTANEEQCILKNTNPHDKRKAFIIDKKGMQFDTNQFYQYVFSDVNTQMEVEILDKTDGDDNAAKRFYGVISEITSGVINRMNEKCFAASK